MPVHIRCARCNSKLMLGEEHLGRLTRCPACENIFRLELRQVPEGMAGEPDVEPSPAVLDLQRNISGVVSEVRPAAQSPSEEPSPASSHRWPARQRDSAGRIRRRGDERGSKALVITAITLPAIVLLGIGLFFLIRLVSAGPRVDESAWTEFRPPGARCRLLVPGTPVTQQQEGQTLYGVALKRPNCAFLFSHMTIPRQRGRRVPLDQLFEMGRQGMLANSPGARLVSQRNIKLDGHPGREFVMDIKPGKRIIRVYIVGGRDLYLLGAGGDHFEPENPDVLKFFNSFALDRQTPPNQGPEGTPPLATLPLACTARDVCVGGDGDFLLLHLQAEGKLAVFDARQAKIVQHLPTDAAVLLAGGRDHCIVALPRKNLLERWSLKTLTREQSVPSPFKGPVQALAMGSASAGPLVVVAGGVLHLLDPQTFKPSEDRLGEEIHVGPGFEPSFLRVSADGRVIVARTSLLVRQDKGYKCLPAPEQAVPGPDGQTLYAPERLYTAEGKPIGEQVGGHGKMVWYMPAAEGPLCLSLDEVNDGRFQTLNLSIYSPGDRRKLGTLQNPDGLQGLVDWGSGNTQPFHRHVFAIPKAKLVVVLPVAKDRLVLHRLDVGLE